MRGKVNAITHAAVGEKWSVGEMEGGRIGPLVLAASVDGSVAVLVELWSVRAAEVSAYLAGEVAHAPWHHKPTPKPSSGESYGAGVGGKKGAAHAV